MYESGHGVDVDEEKALVFYAAAAQQGCVKSTYNCGVLEERAGDFRRAADWYGKAASLGCGSAQNNLGILYRRGRGVPQDNFRAKELWLSAAMAGHASAQANLGCLLHTQRDLRSATKWLEEASENGSLKGRQRLERLCSSTVA